MTNIEVLNLLVALVKVFEGCKLKAYQDIVGVWTIGYGETLGVREGMVWTQEQAEVKLRKRLAQFMLAVYKRCPQLYLEPPGRIIACTSLAYNIGVGAFNASSVRRLTYYQDFVNAAKAFLLWNKAGGKVSKGLDNRRHIESLRYLTA
jgi:lysozyme